MLRLFTESRHCLNRAACDTCRDKEGGRQWRLSFERVCLRLPDDNPDFECPYGVQWGEPKATPEQRPPLDAAPVIQPVPRPWPLAARVIEKLRSPEDKGLGSTIARVIDPTGGAVFKRLYKRITGKDCGCGDRANRLDLAYPYT